MFSRLNFVFIWIGFVALVSWYAFLANGFIQKPELIESFFWEGLLFIAEYPPNNTFTFIWVWLAHLYWPIRWITTGQRSPLPWVANKEANNER